MKIEKTGGRIKGVPNKVSRDTRELITSIIDSNLNKFQEDLDSLQPRDRVNAILQLLKFNLPTLKAVEVNTIYEPKNNFNPIIIQFDERATS